MFISPSKILYTSCLELGALNDISPDKDIIGISQTLRKGARYPKLQVVKKDGYYFTLNDTKLKLYRHLEAIGQCGMVRVEKVPIREVPEGIRKLMRVPENMLKSNRGRSSKHKKGKYHSIDSKDEKPTLLSTSSETSSESDVSSDDDSGEESDWSDDDPSDTDIDSSDQDEGDQANESFI